MTFRSLGLFGSGNGVRKPKDHFGELRAGRGLSMLVQRGIATLESENPRLAPIPTASDVAAGLSALKSGVLWCSSLGATRTISGDEVITGAELLALGWNECTDVAGPAADGGSSGVVVVPSVTPTPAFPYHATTITMAGIVAGMRVRLVGCWKPNHSVAGQSNSLTVYLGSGVDWRVCFRNDGSINSPAGVPLAGAAVRHWKRADGWMQFSIEWAAVDNIVWLLCTIDNAQLTFTGDGTSGLQLSNFSFCQVTAQTVENLSDAGTCTITQIAANAPWVESSRLPEDGWWPDGSDVFRYSNLVSKTLAFSAAGYQAINGSSQSLTLTWLSAPYQTPTANATIWSFLGAVAALKIELTTADKLKLTRTTDAGTTTTVTFALVFGHVPAAYSVVLNGTKALLFRQGELLETQAFSLAGATTFTSGAFGGATPMRVAEFALAAYALPAATVLQVHTVLATKRGWRLDPIPLFLLIGQSNMGTNGTGILLSKWGSTAANRPSFHFESYNPSLWASFYSGWGPSRLNHHQDWADSPTVQMFNNSTDVGSQGLYASEIGFAESLGYVSTARFAASGQGIDGFLTGGAVRAAMFAAFDAAIATLGLPFYLAGIVMVHGETDAAALATATTYAPKVRTLVADLVARYDAKATPKLVMYQLHKNSDRTTEPFVELMRAEQAAMAATSADTAIANVDDQLLNQTDNVHLTEGTTQYELGLRLADAAALIGA